VGAAKDRYTVIPRALCFVQHGEEVLLLRGGPHKRLWAGKLNGVGGHIERGEDPATAARREVREETGLEVTGLRLAAVVQVDAGDPGTGVLFFVFTARAATREVGPCPDGDLLWLPVNRLPWEEMVEDLPVLLPRVLALVPGDERLFAAYRYDEQDRLVISFA